MRGLATFLVVLFAATPLMAPAQAAPSIGYVSVLNFRFEDYTTHSSTSIVTVGQPVTWLWGSGATPHTVTSRSGTPTAQAFNSGIHSGTHSFTVTFAQPGMYSYFCAVHASMTGTIVVTP